MTIEEARKYLIGMSYKIGTMGMEFMSEKDGEEMRNAIQSLEKKSIRYVNNWILCSEDYPKELEPVIITYVNHQPELYYKYVKDKPFVATGIYYKEEWYWYSSTCEDYLAEYGRCDVDKIDDAIEVMAWMPLPEPYRKGSEDK